MNEKWERVNRGWGQRPHWVLNRKIKAALKRHVIYEGNYILTIYGEKKTEHEFNASSLSVAKVEALKTYENEILGATIPFEGDLELEHEKMLLKCVRNHDHRKLIELSGSVVVDDGDDFEITDPVPTKKIPL